MKTLGILGGLGPESTGHFYLELVKRFQEEFAPANNAEYPRIIINSIPAKELIDVRDESVLADYREGLRQLELWGADFIVIVCNSAYCFFDELQREVGVPIIDVRPALRQALTRHRPRCVLILASPTSIRHGLYRFPSLPEMPLSENDVAKLGAAISDYNRGANVEATSRVIADLARAGLARGCEVVAGCTEVQAMLGKAGIGHLDPMREVQDTLIDEWRAPPSLIKRRSPIHGFGVFVQVAVPEGSVFYRIPKGNVSDQPVEHWAHLGGRWFSDNAILNWVNHSCTPNCELILHEGRPALRALRNIASSEEVVCDYDRTEIGGAPVGCSCGSKSCRGTFKRI